MTPTKVGPYTSVDSRNLITGSPETHGNRSRSAAMGATLMRILCWYELGLSPEEMALQYSHLSLAQVHAALTHYHANREVFEAEIAEEQEEGDAVLAEWLR